MNEQHQDQMFVKVTCTECFLGVLKPVCFYENTPQFQFWYGVYKEGMPKPSSNSEMEIEVYKENELVGKVRGELTQRQKQKLLELQRATDDCCGYSVMLLSEEEWEEIRRHHDNDDKAAPVSTSLFEAGELDDGGDPFENGSDNLPY